MNPEITQASSKSMETENVAAQVFVSIIIVNYNSGSKLRSCLEHLKKQTSDNFELIIVDNASQDTSIDLAREADLPFTLLEPKENLGFAAANNLAAKKAQGDWIGFLNPDAYPDADWLEAFEAGTKSYPWADAFGSTQLNAVNPLLLDGAGDVCTAYGLYYRGDFGRPTSMVKEDRECFAPCAAAAFYRRTQFLALNGFDERFFCYGEDVDLGFRLRLLGGRAVQLKSAVVHHEGSSITGRYSAFTVYHGHRNRIWVYYKNTPLLLYIATTPLRILVDLVLGAKAVLQGKGHSYLKAMIDGYGKLGQFRRDRTEWAGRAKSKNVASMFVWAPWAVLGRHGKYFR